MSRFSSPSPHRDHSHAPRRNRSSAEWCEDWALTLEGGREPTAVELANALLGSAHLFKQWGNLCFARGAGGLRELSVARGGLLAAVAHAGDEPVRMGDLSEALGVTPRNITTIVDGLEREGLLARRPDPTDRRAILLELTEKGQEQVQQVHALQHDLSEQMFGVLSPNERRTLYILLTRLARQANERTAHRRDDEFAERRKR